ETHVPKTIRPRFDAPYFTFRTRHYRLLGVTLRVRYGDDALEGAIHPVIAHLETSANEASTHTIVVARILAYLFLYCDDMQESISERIDELAPKVKFAMLRCAIQEQDHILQLHAAAIAKDGRLLLLPAPSGSGKTALAARLVAAGCGYFSDEVV